MDLKKLHRTHAHHHIHKTLRKHAPKSVRKIKRLSSFKYPKLLLLVLSIFLSYELFSHPVVQALVAHLDNLNHIGMFISGILMAFGFSAPFSLGFLITSNPGNIIIASILSGLGSALANIFIFKTIKNSFMGEFHELNKTHIIKKVEKIVENNKHVLIRHYLLYICAGILIAAPILPDEIGISMLAGLTTIKQKALGAISFILHTLAVFVILFFSAGF